MKHLNLNIIAAVAATALLSASCTTGYTVISALNSDGSLTKTVYAKANAACLDGDHTQHPFLFTPDGNWDMGKTDKTDTIDFMGEQFIHNFRSSRNYDSPAQVKEHPASEDYASLPYLNGREEWAVRKGLFKKRYSYRCTFPGIAQSMPLPLDRYMSTEEQTAWLESGAAKAYPYMNGLEMYFLLHDLNVQFTDWYKDCMIEAVYNMITADAGDTITAAQKQELFKRMRAVYEKYDFAELLLKTPDVTAEAEIMTEISSNAVYASMSACNKDKWEAGLEDNTYYFPFSYVFRHIAEMPGRLTSANTDLIENGNPVWKVDGFRLLAGDVTLTAESVQPNPWGFAAVAAIILLCILVLFLRRKK